MANAKKTEGGVSVDNGVPVSPSENQYNKYNMTLPQSFSVYNDEGSVIYRGEVEQIANRLRAEIFGEEKPVKPDVPQPEQPEKEEKEKKEKAKNVCVKKRPFFFALSLILMAVVIAAAVTGFFEISFAKYVSIYNYKFVTEHNFAMLDPALSFVSTKFNVDLGSIHAEFFKVFTVSSGEFLPQFVGYALPISIALYVLFALAAFIVSIAGLAGKRREDGTYAKAKLGFLSIAMFILALIAAVSGLYVSGGTIKDIVGFILGKADFSAGYVLYGMVIVPVIMFICTCLTYKKEKRA